MSNKILIVALFGICIGLFFWNKISTPSIAYVRSGAIVEKYSGMVEAKKLYKEKMGQWQSNLDTLEVDYQKNVLRYQSELPSLSKSARAEREEVIRRQEQNIREYVKVLEEKAKSEDDKLTEGVINQINSYIKEYGEKNGYDMIFGATMAGNVLFGKDAIDITEDVLKGLNDSYNSPAK